MGNAESTSLQKCLSRFLPKEQAVIDGIFNKLLGTEAGATKKAKSVTLEMLKVYVEGTLPDSMTVRLYNGMKSVDPTGKAVPPSDSVSKEQLIVFLSDVLRGIAEEKGALILSMISGSQIGTVKGRQVTEFTEDLISSVLQVLKHRKLLKGWSLDQTRDSAEGIKLLATQLTCELRPAGEELPAGKLLEADCDLGSIEDWVFRVSSVSTFLSLVVSQGLCIQLSEGGVGNLLPECRDVHWSKFLSILDLPSVMYLNSQLPVEVQHQWRLLFSTRLHGESFSRLCGQVVHKGPTILVIRDSQGHIFGGFASHSWETKPQFQGSNRCFLFSVKPYLSVYMCTGYNDHYMYLNHGQQTMPNGLGMGGQHNYFGLWVDSNFGKGHSKAKSRCTTYNSPQLSAKEDFSIDAMEVWALGEPPEDAPSKTKKSILNADPEAQALMEMTGKVRQSEGLWEPVEEEEEADK